MLAPKYKLDRTTQYWVIAIFNLIRYVTLWPRPLTFWPWSHVTWCHVMINPFTKFELDPTYRSRVRMTTIVHCLKSKFLRFFLGGGGKWVKFQTFIFLTPKRYFLGGNDVKWRIVRGDVSKDATCGRDGERKKRTETILCLTYCAWGCVQRCDLWAWWRKEKKGRNCHASNWLFAQTTHVDMGPWNFACGVASGK